MTNELSPKDEYDAEKAFLLGEKERCEARALIHYQYAAKLGLPKAVDKVVEYYMRRGNWELAKKNAQKSDNEYFHTILKLRDRKVELAALRTPRKCNFPRPIGALPPPYVPPVNKWWWALGLVIVVLIAVAFHGEADAHPLGERDLTQIVTSGNIDALNHLLTDEWHKGTVDLRSEKHLVHTAIARARITMLMTLIALGADVDAVHNHNTPLAVVIKSEINVTSRYELLTILISAGADINAKSVESTPIVIAIKYCRAAVIETLLRLDIDTAGALGKLIISSRGALRCSDSVRYAELLIKAGAQVVPNGDWYITYLRQLETCYTGERFCSPYPGSAEGGRIAPMIALLEKHGALASGQNICTVRLGGTKKWVGGKYICQSITADGAFCIIDSTAFSCKGLFRHVHACNITYNRPALNIFYCGKRCGEGEKAKGKECVNDV